MTLKTYIAKSVVSLTVPLNDNLWAWINFLPLVDGTSKFLTTKEELQTALEAHPKFGKLFMLDGSESVTGDITMPQVTYYTKDDLQTIWDDSMKPFIQESIGASVVAGRDVYVGTGASYNDVMTAANHHEFVRKGSLVPIAANNAYIWVILPNVYSPVVQLSGMIVPMTEQTPVTLNNVTYKVLRSDSQYAGNFSISLI